MNLKDKKGLEEIEKVDWSMVADFFKDDEIKPTPEIEDILINNEYTDIDDED